MPDFLHNHKEFLSLVNIVADKYDRLPVLVEKDYWIMHVLYGLKKSGFNFELKGGTSLSKGFKIIDRFSEDIDIHIKPPSDMNINENPKNTSAKNIEARKKFYDWLKNNIHIEGITAVERDHEFDDTEYYRSGGIRLHYHALTEAVEGIKPGILLEAGFDKVTPNHLQTISSWAYDEAAKNTAVKMQDNRAFDISCYDPGYTFVEKLQTIATKFRQEQTDGKQRANLMRQYYDCYCLLDRADVQAFIGTSEYFAHKEARFPKADIDIPIASNPAFLINEKELKTSFKKRYEATSALYYNKQPSFEDVILRIRKYINRL